MKSHATIVKTTPWDVDAIIREVETRENWGRELQETLYMDDFSRYLQVEV